MRRITRLDRSIEPILTRATAQNLSSYRCFACRNQATLFSTSSLRTEKESRWQQWRRRFKGDSSPEGKDDSSIKPSQILASDSESSPKTEIGLQETANYEPADTWDGLETIGGYSGWWRDNWDPEHPFKSFLPEKSARVNALDVVAVRRAVVEVFAFKQAGRPLSEVSQIQPGHDETDEVQISQSASGVSLQFSENSSLEKIVQSLLPAKDKTSKKIKTAKKIKTSKKGAPTESEEDVAADRSSEDPLHPEPTPKVDETKEKANPTESEEDVAADRSTVDPLHKSLDYLKAIKLLASQNPSWELVSLADPEIKFAVIKRTMQLTGIHIPDYIIKNSNTVKALLSHITTPPKPRKLVEALKQKEDLMALPNVNVAGRRITSIDKQRSIGLRKVIERELVAHELPLTGA